MAPKKRAAAVGRRGGGGDVERAADELLGVLLADSFAQVGGTRVEAWAGFGRMGEDWGGVVAAGGGDWRRRHGPMAGGARPPWPHPRPSPPPAPPPPPATPPPPLAPPATLPAPRPTQPPCNPTSPQTFRPVTLERPKALLPLAGSPLISYALEWLAAGGVDEVRGGGYDFLQGVGRVRGVAVADGRAARPAPRPEAPVPTTQHQRPFPLLRRS